MRILSLTLLMLQPLAVPTVQAFEWKATWSNTWGYKMMSARELQQYEMAISKLQTRTECDAFLKEHNTIIQQRIDDWVITPKRAQPVDTCADLEAQGLIK